MRKHKKKRGREPSATQDTGKPDTQMIGDVKDIVRAVVKEILQPQAARTVFHDDTDLTDFGLDSLSFVGIVIELENSFHIEYPEDLFVLSQVNCVDAFAAAVTRALS